MFQEELSYLFEQSGDISERVNIFNVDLPKEWVDEACQLTEHVTVRRRKIMPENVVSLVIGMSLMRNESIPTVAARLAFKSKQLDEDLVARSSLSNARQRLGSAPVEWLFNKCAEHWNSHKHADSDWQGLGVYAIDGTSLRTEDTPECREFFGSANTNNKRVSAFPAFRLTCLMNTRTQLILKAGISEFKTGEITVASQLIDSVPNKSILLMDKLYHSAELLHHIEQTGEERYWMTPLRKDIKWSVVEQYGENDMLVERSLSSHARGLSPNLPKRWQFRVIKYQIPGFETRYLATSLPYDRYPAAEIVELYHERWSIELSYRDIKKTMLKNAITLRSKKPDLVIQELYGMLIAYNLIRHEAARAGDVVGLRGTRISFNTAMRVVIYDYYGMATTNSLHTLPARLADLTDTLKDFILPKPKRPRPNYPRVVKMQKKQFPTKRSQPLKNA